MGFVEFSTVSGVGFVNLEFGFVNLEFGFVGIFCVCEPRCMDLVVWVAEIGVVWPWVFELV